MAAINNCLYRIIVMTAFALLFPEWTRVLILIFCDDFIGDVSGLHWELNIFTVFVMCESFAGANTRNFIV
jgi:hypothetical protein